MRMFTLLQFGITLLIFLYVFRKIKADMDLKQKKRESDKVDAQINQTKSFVAGTTVRSQAVRSQAARVQTVRPQSAPVSAESQRVAERAAIPADRTAKREEERPVTEMLAEKARKDQIEHRREELEQARHEKTYYSGYRYAKRYLPGDEVPSGERLVYCPNCAAENLIRITDNPKKFNCYFCREQLE